jgi:hypothetical protein
MLEILNRQLTRKWSCCAKDFILENLTRHDGSLATSRVSDELGMINEDTVRFLRQIDFSTCSNQNEESRGTNYNRCKVL